MIEKVTVVRELDTLIQQQISTLKQDKKIPDTDLRDYSRRSARIHELYAWLDRVKNGEFAGRKVA
jgi:hypothetical protein